MVLDKKEIRRTINEIQVPYADSQTGRIALTIYIDLIVEAIYSKFSQQPPKERKVSLEEIKIIKSVLDYYNLTEDGFYTDVISEEIAKRLNAVLDGKEGG